MEVHRADFVKLSAWFVHDLQSDTTGHFDGDAETWPHPQLLQLREQFVYTYGFSFVYRRELFPTFSFAATSWGEDQDILKKVRPLHARHASATSSSLLPPPSSLLPPRCHRSRRARVPLAAPPAVMPRFALLDCSIA